MSGFAPDWLALREPADFRARDAGLAAALSARFIGHEHATVVDLGCGTGSNLRATSALLPDRQSWRLIDHDPALLAVARAKLTRWADAIEDAADEHQAPVGSGALLLHKGRQRIAVTFRQADLAGDLEGALGDRTDLVTASALFDLASADFIRRFATAVAARRSIFYTVLTYNGIQHWAPRRPADNAMTAAFHGHQMTDKGFGPAAGPTAAAHLADQFRLNGYSVSEGDSPWRLQAPRDAALVTELATGFAAAVGETGKVDKRTLDDWKKLVHTGAETGHTDTLAVPAE